MCSTHLDLSEHKEARERLHRAVGDWLSAAPAYTVDVKADGSIDRGYPSETKLLSVLRFEDAVIALGSAVNQYDKQLPCPDSLAVHLIRGRWEFEFLRFVEIKPTLPDGYSDVLLRTQDFTSDTGSHPELDRHWVGSVYQSQRGEVVVVWHRRP